MAVGFVQNVRSHIPTSRTEVREKFVSVRDGTPMVTDGPFAETKEQLAGYYLVECAGWEAALGIAARIPSAADGSASIEVRPVWDFTPIE